MQNPQPHPDDQSLAAMLRRYAEHLPPGGANNDEMLAPDGTVKPVWADLAAHIATLSPSELSFRFARGDQYLSDAGVLYRQYDESLSTEREWPLSHLPVLVGEDEWRALSEGLIERAELLEFVLSDFYGDNTLVNSGQLPSTLLSQNPAWLRPMMGQGAHDGPRLNTVSFEIGRGPDGTWWVISDLIEAPSTAGFAIENRIATARTFPNFFDEANIHKLGGYFQDLQRNLEDLRGGADGEIALLSPGPMNQNHAEHAYIARYLGLLLVEGEDLIVHDGRAMVRTVAGLKPVSLLWNRLPSTMFDPLELDPSSMLGAAGLVQAIRDGTLKTVNMVGAGVLETRALMAFLPRIARGRLGKPLTLPNIATWWCGQEAQRDHVIANHTRMMVGNAFSTLPLMADPQTISLASVGEGRDTPHMKKMLHTSGRDLVGQEDITLSTTPAFENGQLVARPMCVRISLSRTAQGWTVMPGGYARISGGADAKALTMQRGGKVADVWVTSADKVQTPSLLAAQVAPGSAMPTLSVLPSRAADNLFWLGRYVERAQQNMRLFRAYFARVLDGQGHGDLMPSYMRAHLLDGVSPNSQDMAARFGAPLTLGLQAATRISDRFSPDGMMALRALVHQTRALDARPIPLDEIPIEVSGLLRQITGFAGLVHENMYRSDGWRFMSLGISLERAANMCTLLSACTDNTAPTGAFDMALEVGDSVVAHRVRFRSGASVASVTDLLALDAQNPRSVRYHVTRAKTHIKHLPRQNDGHRLTDVARAILLVETQLASGHSEEITPAILNDLRGQIWDTSTALNDQYFV